MESLERCLGHVIGRCPDCTYDDKNKECPNYNPIILRTFEVKEDYIKEPPKQ